MIKINLFLKRVMDLLGSLLGLIILSPFLMLIGIMIKMESRGPIFFKQERLGLRGRVFKIFKFRTMINNAESSGTGVFTSESDTRITKVGRVLRATSIDELPQLINVFLGQMSLVGPRPPVPYHPYKYHEYPEKYKLRFEMKPGITGLSQVRVRNSASWDKRIMYDIDYVNDFNVFKDLLIILSTFKAIFVKDKLYRS